MDSFLWPLRGIRTRCHGGAFGTYHVGPARSRFTGQVECSMALAQAGLEFLSV
jgi:hypothetical protein